MDEFLKGISEGLQNLWVRVGEQAPTIFFALVSFILGIYFARFAQSLVRRGLRYRKADPEIVLLLGRLARWSIVIFVVLFATQQVGVDVTAFLTGIGILGFTLGFALQDVSKNFIAGILILLQKPFSLGDRIEVSGFTGVVQDISLRDTVMRTDDGLSVRIPNGDIFVKPVTNFSRLPRRRIQIPVRVGFKNDLERVRQITLEAIAAIPGVFQDPAPEVVFESFGEYAIHMRVAFWYDEGQITYPRALDSSVSRLKAAFDKAGIEIPIAFPRIKIGDVEKMQPDPNGANQTKQGTNLRSGRQS